MRKIEMLSVTTALKLAVVGVGSTMLAETAHAQSDVADAPISRSNPFPKDIVLLDSQVVDKKAKPPVPQTIYMPQCKEQTANQQGFISKGRLQLKVK